jgi:hypothetical protein
VKKRRRQQPQPKEERTTSSAPSINKFLLTFGHVMQKGPLVPA